MIKVFYHSPVSLEKYILLGGGIMNMVPVHENSAWKVASIQTLGNINTKYHPTTDQKILNLFFFKMIFPCCSLDNKNNSRFKQNSLIQYQMKNMFCPNSPSSVFIVVPCMLIILSSLFVQLMHTNYYKIVKQLKPFKIIIVAPTCFGLHKPSSGSSQPVLR